MQQELEGALIALVSVGVGRFIPNRRRRPKPPPPIKPICGCMHHKSSHDPKTGACNAAVERPKYNSIGDHIGIEYRDCACRQYVGPEPHTEFYPPEMSS